MNLVDFWVIDPLPVPPAPFGSTAYWRWLSALTLAERRI
jgi:hypothetical protein